jgi:ABC-type bacteriocin/lantibiotic exporter with double-glycine peptidase domain
MILIFFITGPRGVKTSIFESKAKYLVAHWLEELARVMGTFKLAGNTSLPLNKTNYYVNKYLKFRKQHFNVLILQFSNIVAFKTVVTAGLLILGSILVINQEINLGQFVASELIIVLVLSSAEKIILTMETVYDVLAGIDKLGQVTDVPLEREEGRDLRMIVGQEGVHIALSNLSYKYPDGTYNALNEVNLDINPGERVCITGNNQSGKSTLISLISGLYHEYDGSILYNGIPLRDINLTSLRSVIGDNLSQQDLFLGTLEENISVGKEKITLNDLLWSIEQVGLQDYFKELPKGLNTLINPVGQGLSGSIRQKIILARTFAEKPKVVIMDNALIGLDRDDREKISKLLMDKKHPWTLVAVTDDPFMIAHCDKVVVMEKGRIVDIKTAS